jgi:hypothetical protein
MVSITAVTNQKQFLLPMVLITIPSRTPMNLVQAERSHLCVRTPVKLPHKGVQKPQGRRIGNKYLPENRFVNQKQVLNRNNVPYFYYNTGVKEQASDEFQKKCTWAGRIPYIWMKGSFP